MIDFIYIFKFVHVLAVAAMLGGWLTIALFMLLAHRSGNTPVVALTARFVVQIELMVIVAAVAVQPISGFLLAGSIGLAPLEEFWILLSLGLYGLVVAAWAAALRVEFLIRDLAREAALESQPLPDRYRRLFRLHALLVWPALGALVVLVALMVWQPRMS